MENNSVYSVAKIVIGITWLAATACFFPPVNAMAQAGFGRTLFGVLAAVHVVECIAFMGVLRKSSRPLIGEIWQTFLFGIVHISEIRAELAKTAGQ